MSAVLWKDVFWITLGAAIGANLRYAVNRLALNFLSASVPYGTLIVNVTGSLILGFFLIWTSERVLADPYWRLLIAVGFCGAYTTFSSYSFETFAMLEQGHYVLATANFCANNLLCLAGVLAGAALARMI
jgi:CrcB protein